MTIGVGDCGGGEGIEKARKRTDDGCVFIQCAGGFPDPGWMAAIIEGGFRRLSLGLDDVGSAVFLF